MDRQELILSFSKQKMKPITGSILLVVFIICCLPGKAQNEKDSASNAGLKSFLKFKLSFESGLAWEQKIGKTSALELLAGISIALQSDGFSDLNVPLIVIPTTEVQFRHYYNFKRRLIQQKKIRNNSANFLWGEVQTLFPIKNQNFFGFLIGQGWGIQRSIGKRFGAAFRIGVIEHFYYDKPPVGGYNYLKIEPEVMTSVFYIF